MFSKGSGNAGTVPARDLRVVIIHTIKNPAQVDTRKLAIVYYNIRLELVDMDWLAFVDHK